MDPIDPDMTQPQLPAVGSEATTAMVHYYRAEVGRMTSWRNRLDLTSNWAITVVAAMLSVSLSTAGSHHGVLLFAMLLLSLLLYVEARRYRFYDVYRMRVRLFERHYFARLFAPGSGSGAEPWLTALAEDLRHPRFRISLSLAATRRLRRNYVWMYLILLLAWCLKIASPQLQETGQPDTGRPIQVIIAHAALGPIPGLVVLAAVLAFNLALVVFAFKDHRRADEDQVHV